MDLMYFESPPGLQLLHCLQNSVTGGTSVFYDIFGAVERLKIEHPSLYEVLCKQPVRFQYIVDSKSYEYERPTIQEDSLNDGLRVFYSPPFQGPLNIKPGEADLFYEAFAQFELLLKDPKYLYRYLLKPGDIVLFANRRVLHSREAFDSASGDRWFDWDDIKNEIRMTDAKM
jgi:gamma-butyrobetaine dioxygenase